MSNVIQVGNTVKANRDLPNKSINKGDVGEVYGIILHDSEAYLYITLFDNRKIEMSCENCWDKVVEERCTSAVLSQKHLPEKTITSIDISTETIGMQALKNDDGTLDIISFNVVAPPYIKNDKT